MRLKITGTLGTAVSTQSSVVFTKKFSSFKLHLLSILKEQTAGALPSKNHKLDFEIIQVRQRFCIGGDPGVDGCRGPVEQPRDCNTGRCSFWGPWISDGPCSMTCNGGSLQRSRICELQPGGVEGTVCQSSHFSS